MDTTDKGLIGELLALEHNNMAVRLGLIDGTLNRIADEHLGKYFALVDRLSKKDGEFARRACVLAAGMLWTHCAESVRGGLHDVLVPALSRIGVAPATMLVDSSFRESGKYSALSSYFDEIQTLAYQLETEVEVGGEKFLLTRFQSQLWDAIQRNRIIGVSAPTSAGKSFVIYLKLLELVMGGATIVLYIVPTLSLVSQVSRDLSELFKRHGVQVEILNTYQEAEQKTIVYVLTQERAIAAFSREAPFFGLDVLVVDEIQNIERVAADEEQRSKILFDVLKEIKDGLEPGRIILSGPRLKNVGDLGFEIFGDISHQEESKVSPVVNITYSIKREKEDAFLFSQYSDLFEQPRSMYVKNHEDFGGFGKSLYKEDFHRYLTRIVRGLGPASRNIIFSPTSNQARKTAEYLDTAHFSGLGVGTALGKSLGVYVRETVSPHYKLADLVEHGVAFHTGKLPMHVRMAVEEAFSNGTLNTVVCTTTLMQGVNFPADTVIVRNPNLFVRRRGGEEPRLSSYEFANLRGRAGRLLKEFVGRTIVLDEGAFEIVEEGQESLFEDTHKELTAGYGEYFERHEPEVLARIASPAIAPSGPEKPLVTYIRQVLLKLGAQGEERLREVGIHLSEDDVKRTIETLSSLVIPKDICSKNRYWDPFDLDRILLGRKRGEFPELPSNVWVSGLQQTLTETLTFFERELPYYFRRYIGEPGREVERLAWSIGNYAEKWAREVPLKDIIAARAFGEDSDEEIDRLISRITSAVSYGLPMLLMPIRDLDNPDSGLPSAIESGAFSAVTKWLIERGVPRETAIALKGKYLGAFGEESAFSTEIPRVLRGAQSQMDVWTRAQIRVLL